MTKTLEIKINGKDDHAGYKLADQKRKEIKTMRVAITKTAKTLRQEAIDYQKMVISKEKLLIEALEPYEIHLEKEQEKYEEENRLHAEMLKAQAAEKVNKRINDLLKVADFDGNFYSVESIKIDNLTVINCTDEYFNEFIKDATALREKIDAEKLAIETTISERKEKLNDAGLMFAYPNYIDPFGIIRMSESELLDPDFDAKLQIIIDNIRIEKENYLKKQKEIEDALRLKEELEIQNRKLLAQQREMLEERSKNRGMVLSSIGLNFNGSEWTFKDISISATSIMEMDDTAFTGFVENKKAEIAVIKKAIEKLAEEQKAFEIKQAAEKAQKELLEKQEKEKQEKERQALLEEQRKAAAPDIEKALSVIQDFNNITMPDFKTDKGKKLSHDIKVLKTKTVMYIQSEIDKWQHAL